MKIALVLAGNIWFAPYLSIYTKMLDEWKISYEIISWNRDGNDPNIGIQYGEKLNVKNGGADLLSYWKYLSFVKKKILQNRYSKLIVFGPQIGILLHSFLRKYYNGRYILDYRDLSIEQKFYLQGVFKSLLKHSYANVISSPGFKKYLPSNVQYYISHNFDASLVECVLESKSYSYKWKAPDVVDVLTIGGIRDYSSNIEIIKSLANNSNFMLRFIGKGHAADLSQQYTIKYAIQNVSFEGFYSKEKEGTYIEKCTFLNVFYPTVKTHSTALSNRFYNALIYKKPMIVTSNSTQGDLVDNYQLGISIVNTDNLVLKLNDYISNFDYLSFCQRCDLLLSSFMNDYLVLKKMVKNFVL